MMPIGCWYGRHIGNEIDKALSVPLDRLEDLHLGLAAVPRLCFGMQF